MDSNPFALLLACCSGNYRCNVVFYKISTNNCIKPLEDHAKKYFSDRNPKTGEYYYHWIIVKEYSETSDTITLKQLTEQYSGNVVSTQKDFDYTFQSTNIAKEIFTDIIETTFTAHNNASQAYQRCTFVKMGECRGCLKHCSQDDITWIKPQNFEGYMNLYGWIVCNNCLPYAEILYHYDELRNKAIYFNRVKDYRSFTSIKFWRVSSNPSIKPYLEKNGYFAIDSGDIFHINLETYRIYTTISWRDEKNLQWFKSILLSNFIFYNRDIAGSSPIDLPFMKEKNEINSHNIWKSRWIPRLECSYNLANKIRTWLLCINRMGNIGRLPKDITNELIKDINGTIWKHFLI
jgi:hypothetical protein